MDEALPSRKTTHRLEARGVPFGLRTWRHLEQLIRPIGTLRKVVCNGLHAGDPNFLCLDVEMESDMDVPQKLQMAGGGGAGLEILLAALPPPPPPPPLPICPQPAPSSGATQQMTPAQVIQEQQPPLKSGTPPPPPPRLSLPHSSPKLASPVLSTDMPQGEVMVSPPAQAMAPLLEDDAPRYLLSVYQSRRRYRSTPATTRDTRSWLTRHEEQHHATTRPSSPAGAPDLPPLTSQGSPGTRDITSPELI